MLAGGYNKMGTNYEQAGKADSGLVYAKLAVQYAEESNNTSNLPFPLGTLAECYISLKEYDRALIYLNQSHDLAVKYNDLEALSWAMQDYARLYLETNQQDSARYWGNKAIEYSTKLKFRYIEMFAYKYMYESFEKTDTKDSVHKYFKLWALAKDSLLNTTKTKALQTLNFTNQLEEQEAEKLEIQFRDRLIMYAMLAALCFFLSIGLILYRNNRQKQKANALLQDKNEEIQSALETLKIAQAQLIQSEKLASLGELTAGISHEIQNPLNFVTNFSELSIGLVEDIKVEIERPEIDKPYLDELFTDLKHNQEKINIHGKRASSIVKGMLSHSRTSTGTREWTDISQLADEYLRLSYHGLRAKDKSFNSDFKTHFADNLPNVEIVNQDIGRVFLNLINNAFYAVYERKKQQREPGFEPLVSVSTEKIDKMLVIKIKDNGIGMPESVKAKIFEPFFTTKPTGEGTGLGLSLSYDILTKGHGGSLAVDSSENVGTTFTITLPLPDQTLK
jgi:two-component system, NtrC family, sensor kinase